LYAQLLIAASFVMASFQDFRERTVSDLVWLPGLGGVAYILYALYLGNAGTSVEFYVLKLALIGGVAIGSTFLGYVGQADGIAIALVAADPSVLSPFLPLLGAAAFALGHISYEYAKGNARGVKTIPMSRFLREQHWIPKAIVEGGTRTEVSRDVNVAREEVVAAQKPDAAVEVRYGVPTVAYLGIGYAAYVIYLVAFSFGMFASLP
jgi:hypothetical protein